MKRKDKEGLHKKTLKELEHEMTNISQELIKLKFAVSLKREKNVRKPTVLRDDLARIKTVIAQKLKEVKTA